MWCQWRVTPSSFTGPSGCRERRDRQAGLGQTLRRRFNLTTGLLSIVSNVVLMRLLAGTFGLPYLAANLLAITITSAGNFLVSEFFVFARRGERS